MIIVTSTEIEQFRTELAESPQALMALDMIEDCEGDLEDAAISLAIQVGQQPDTSERWLEGLAKRWRSLLCQSDFREDFLAGRVAGAIQHLAETRSLPTSLATPMVIYVMKTGIEDFCRPLSEML